jgi:quercetin dioxygenase-like cupin family protein
VQAFHYTDVAAQDVEECPGVTIRWVLAQNVGAPHFAMRIISLEPGAATEYHEHAWEHEVYVLEGEGVVRAGAERGAAIGPGSCVYVQPNEIHNFRNTGDTLMRFICVIPNPEG